MELDALIVVRLHMGLLFDEIRKIKLESESKVYGNCMFSISKSIKNGTINREYDIREWPGNASLQH